MSALVLHVLNSPHIQKCQKNGCCRPLVTVRNEVAKVRLCFYRRVSVHGGGGSASVHAGIPHPPEADPPGSRPPGRDSHCCGRYASYWNAFLSFLMFPPCHPWCRPCVVPGVIPMSSAYYPLIPVIPVSRDFMRLYKISLEFFSI